MTPLEYDQRIFVRRAVLQARQYERAQARTQLAEQLRAEIAAAREAMRQEIEALREEMRVQAENLQQQMAALHRALTRAREESELLRRWWHARQAHEKAKGDLLANYRQHQLEQAWETKFDALTMRLQ
jgi:hypothetical protein